LFKERGNYRRETTLRGPVGEGTFFVIPKGGKMGGAFHSADHSQDDPDFFAYIIKGNKTKKRKLLWKQDGHLRNGLGDHT